VIKICGITNQDDLNVVAELGPDAVGFVFAESPRRVSLEDARHLISLLPPGITAFGVFVNPKKGFVDEAVARAGIDVVQLHGDEPPEFARLFYPRVVKAIRVKRGDDLSRYRAYEPFVRGFLVDAWSVDAYGGTGKTVDLELARSAQELFERPVILAGGFGPKNLSKVVNSVQPYGVDVSSGVEIRPGKKDPGLVRDFMIQAKALGL